VVLISIGGQNMQTIIITLDPAQMDNPDLDIRYLLPDRIDEYTEGAVRDNGYDYLDNDIMAIWLETEDAAGNVEKVITLIESEEILENNLSKAAVIYISEEDSAELDQCKKVYP
jgi:myo-inositol-hexaphosphate 3-phosphohydrolase